MKTFEKSAAQGDVLFRRVAKVPAEAKLVKTKGPVVVAHSETGHHHAFVERAGVKLYSTDNPLVCYLQIADFDAPGGVVELKHLRPFDTHESIGFKPGCYEVRRQRERAPEGWRRVAD